MWNDIYLLLQVFRMYVLCVHILQVLYSENGLTWKYVKVGSEVKLFEGNPQYYHAIAHSFDPPLRVRERNSFLTFTKNRSNNRCSRRHTELSRKRRVLRFDLKHKSLLLFFVFCLVESSLASDYQVELLVITM